MHKYRSQALLVFLTCLSCFYSIASDTDANRGTDSVPRFEIMGGYTYLRMSNGLSQPQFGVQTRMGTNGWIAAGTYRFNRYLGATAEFSANYSGGYFGTQVISGTHQYNFLFGPTFSYHSKSRLTPFGHGLFGVSHLSIPGLPLCQSPANFSLPLTYCSTVSQNSFAMAFGGGADLRVSRRFSVRLAQFDYLYTRHTLVMPYDGPMPTPQNQFRYAGGIIINLY
jgi:hypothetical protein